MFSKKLFPNALPISLVLSGILVGSGSVMPAWAMKEDTIEIVSRSPSLQPTLKTDHFEYDSNYLEEAKQTVSHALFLPELIRAQFETAAQHYDRKKCLEYFNLEVEAQDDFLINLDPLCKMVFQNYKKMIDEDEEEVKDDKKAEKIKIIKENLIESLKKDYAPYMDMNNIKNIFDTKGEFNTDIFDAFFYHVLGVHPGFFGTTYPKKDIQNLLEQLREVKFLKNIDLNQLLSLKETYKPLHQLEKFFKKYGKKPLILIIGEGHSGVPGFDSISRYIYGEVLTIDIQSHCLPDITSDINDLSLLTGLKKYYPEHFDFILDTTNMGFPGAFQGKTFEYLFSLLRPGGQFKQTGLKNPCIRPEAMILIKEYNFKPIYCEEGVYKEEIIALEKPEKGEND